MTEGGHPKDPFDLSGEVAVVTGATGTLGGAMARGRRATASTRASSSSNANGLVT